MKEMHQLQYACVKMEDIGAVTEGISKKFKPILRPIRETRVIRPT